MHHSISWTTFAIAWSAAARPSGRNGVESNRSISSCLAAIERSSAAWAPSPVIAARTPSESDRAARATAPRSGFAAPGGESASAAAVPKTDASHQPASRSGIIAAVPGEATGRT